MDDTESIALLITVIDDDLDMTTRQLYSELQDLDLESVALVKQDSAPQGAKLGDPVLLGTLAVAVGPLVLSKLLEFLHAWAMRGEGRTIRIKIELADRSLEAEVPATMSRTEVQIWINGLREALTGMEK